MKKFLRLENHNSDKIIQFAVLLSLMLSIFAVFVKQPMSWYDEETHYSRVLQLANGDFKVIKDNDLSQVGGNISIAEDEFIVRSFNSKLLGSNYPAVDFWWFDKYSDISYTEEKVFRASTNTIINVPIVYTPYIFVAVLSKIFHLPPAIQFFLMRLVGLCLFYLIYLFAIRKSKKGKLILSLLLLAPPVFLTFSAITADAYLISISTLFFIYLFELLEKIINKSNITQKEIFILIFVSFLFDCTKLPNFIFLGLLLPLIYFLFNDKKTRVFSYQLFLTLLFCAILTITFYFLVGDVNTGLFWGRNVDTLQQLGFISSHLKLFVLLLFYTIFNFNYFELQTGYGNINIYSIPNFISVLYFFSLYLSTYSQTIPKIADKDNSVVENKRVKLFYLCSALAVLLFTMLVFISLYLQFSEIGATVIDGVQARYFVSIWFFLLLLLGYSNTKRTYQSNKLILALAVLPSIFFILYLVMAIFTNGLF